MASSAAPANAVPNYEPNWNPNNGKRATRRRRQLATKLAANNNFMRRVMKTVKVMNKPASVSGFDRAASRRFIAEMARLPVYVIRAHSCIESPATAKKRNVPQTIEIPADTYIVTFGSPGDYMCTSNNRLINIKARLADIRKYMYLHSQSDVIPHKSTKPMMSIFSDMKRAAQTREEGAEKIMYPNISYTMNNIDPERMTRTAAQENEYGVYRIDNVPIFQIQDFTNKDNSLVSQSLYRDDWSLSQIIEEVYEKTGMRKGIFISLGCLSACGDSSGAPDFLMDMAYLYEEANLLYNTVRPTMTKGDVLQHFGEKALAKDVPTNQPLTRWTPGMYERMVKEGLIDPEEWTEMLENMEEEDWGILYKMAGLD
jgi:hypothetical protein